MNGENIKDLEKSKTDNVFVGCFFFFFGYMIVKQLGRGESSLALQAHCWEPEKTNEISARSDWLRIW